MAPLTITKVPAPHDGIDLVSTPDSMSSTRAPWMENFLVGNYGKLPVRGAVEVVGTDAGATALTRQPVSLVRDPVQLAYWVTRAGDVPITGRIRPDEIPYRVAATNADLDVGTTKHNAAATVLTGGNFFGRGATANRSCWGFEYSAAVSTQDVPILNGPRQWKRSLARLSNGALTLFDHTKAPACGVDVEVHNNLLWVLGGYQAASVPASAAWTSSCLFFTGGGDAAIWGAPATFGDLTTDGNLRYGTDRDWRNVSNVINRIEIPGSDEGKALVRLGNNLVVFKERSIWVLYGSDEDSYTLRNVTSDIGLWDRDSIVETDGGIYFMSSRGYEFFDGSSVISVSEMISPLFDDMRNRPFYFRRATAGVVSGNYLEVRIENVSVFRTAMAMLLHRSTRNWTSFTGSGFSLRSICLREGGQFIEADKTWTYALVDGVSNHLVTSTFEATRSDAIVYYRPLKLGGIGYRSQIHRVFLDTKATIFGAPGDTSRLVWTWQGESTTDVRYINGETTPRIFSETIHATAATLPWSSLGYALTRFWQGRHNVVDVFDEVDDIMFVVRYAGGVNPGAPSRAEIREGAVEWAAAAPSKSAQLRESVPR